MKPGTGSMFIVLLIIGLFTACIPARFTPAGIQAVFDVKQNNSADCSNSRSKSASRYERAIEAEIPFSQLTKSAIMMIHLLENEEQTATILLTGDLMCLGGQQRVAKQGDYYDFFQSFSKIRELLQSADLCIGNLETLISPSNPYTINKKIIDGNPNCNAMASYLSAIKQAGFDAVATANNHCLDGLEDGVIETISYLDQYELSHIGTRLSKEGSEPLIFECNGIWIALLSYTELINRRDDLPAEQVETYVSCYSQKQVIQDVLKARKAGAEVVIAYTHWGRENTHEVTKRQKQHAYEMAQAGVDVIIGSHPHCLQPAEYITTTEGKQVLCMYSMGNFLSSMTREINSDTIALQLTITKDVKDEKEKPQLAIEAGYYAIKSISAYEDDHYVLFLAAENQKEKALNDKLKKARERIHSIINSVVPEIIE